MVTEEDERLGVRRLLREAGAVRFGQFTLTSGAPSDVYVDIKAVSTEPHRLREIARALARHAAGATLLAGMELGAVPIVVAVALETGLPYAIVRKKDRTHGTGQRVEGTVPPGARCLVLEDVTTTGGSLAETVEAVRVAGALVDRAVTVVDRESGGKERLATLGVHLAALATLAELRRDGV